MSIPAHNWVKEHPNAPNGEPYTPMERLVLYALAWHHNGKTGRCDPSVGTLVKSTSIKSRSTVQRTLKALAVKQAISIEHDRPRERNPSPTSNAYTFIGLQGVTPPLTAAGFSRSQQQGAAAHSGRGGRSQQQVGEHEVNGKDQQEEKENPFSFSSVQDGAEPEALPTWPEWIAIYTGHTREGIMPGVEGGYLEKCRTGESPPPCTLGDLEAIIDLIRLCWSWVAREPGRMGPDTYELPGPGDIGPLVRSAQQWRAACAVRPEWATSEGLAEAWGYVMTDRDGTKTINHRRTVEANVNRTGRRLTEYLERERKRAERDAEPAPPRRRSSGRGRVREESGNGKANGSPVSDSKPLAGADEHHRTCADDDCARCHPAPTPEPVEAEL